MSMKKWQILVTGNDGRQYFLHYHVIAADPNSAKRLLADVVRNTKPAPPQLRVKEINELEDADLFLPGVVYKSGKAYFDT